MGVFPSFLLVSGTGGGARVLARGSTRCGRAPEVAIAGERLVGLNDSGETTVPESGSDCPVASFVDDSIPLGSSSIQWGWEERGWSRDLEHVKRH